MLGVRFGLVVAVTLCGGCAQVVPPREFWRAAIANPEPSLHLVDGTDWRVFEVSHPAWGWQRLDLREEATPAVPPIRLPLKGAPAHWFHPINLLVPTKIYERNGHSANYRFRHPWSGEEWVLAARARSRSIVGISMPPREEATPRLLFYEGSARPRKGREPLGEIVFDSASRRLFSGQVAGREVEIERVGTLAWDREPGLLQHLTSSFPGSGEFVVRIDGRETARFLQRRKRGTYNTFRLAIRRDQGETERDLSLWLFLGFDRMREFVLDLD